MAELKGPFQFTGSIGNLRAYYNKTLKRYFLSGKGGSTKELIMNNPAFARQLENMSEFKACGMWSSQLRKCLISISHLFMGYYFGEIVSMAKKIQKNDDVHVRGSRSIASSQVSWLLKTHCFNHVHLFDQMLTHQYNILFSADKKSVTMELLEIKSFYHIHWPERYESYRIALVIARISDLVKNEKEGRYEFIVPNNERLSICKYSDWHKCSTDSEDIILTASFAEPALPQPGTTVIVALGIEVSTSFGGSSQVKQSVIGSMKIVECYV